MTTFSQYTKSYLKKKGYRWSESTRVNYESRLGVLAEIVFSETELKLADTELEGLWPSDLDEIAADLYKTGGHQRCAEIMRLLVRVLNDAHKNGKCSRSFEWKPLKQKDRKKADPMSPEEVRKVIGKIDPHYHPIFWFLYCTGCRPGEAKALRWSDIDEDLTQVSIERGRVYGKDGSTKTGKFRSVPLNKKIRAVLKSMERGADDGFVFISKGGNPINGHLDRIWRNAAAKAGIRHRPSYNLRHSFGSAALYNGVAMPVVSRILGHADMATTMRFYAGIIKDMPENTDKLDGMCDEEQTA